MANSFKQMIADKIIKRPDGRMTIHIDQIHIRPGFNVRKDDERNREANESLFRFMMDNGIKRIPALEVEARDEGGVYVVEGHRRITAHARQIDSLLDTCDTNTTQGENQAGLRIA